MQDPPISPSATETHQKEQPQRIPISVWRKALQCGVNSRVIWALSVFRGAVGNHRKHREIPHMIFPRHRDDEARLAYQNCYLIVILPKRDCQTQKLHTDWKHIIHSLPGGSCRRISETVLYPPTECMLGSCARGLCMGADTRSRSSTVLQGYVFGYVSQLLCARPKSIT